MFREALRFAVATFAAARPGVTALAAATLAVALPAGAQVGNVAIQPRMGDPIPGLNAAELDRFDKGKLEFEHILTTPEGVGPIFNDTGCGQCHAQPRVGGFSALFVTRFGKAALGQTPFDPLAGLGGSLLQSQAISPTCLETVPPQADVTTHRITPPIFGAGLVEAVPDSVFYGLEANPPGGGVSGIAHRVKLLEDPQGRDHVGRFGWKAQVATMLSFSGDASLNEMGLTNRLVGTENAPNGNQALLAQCDTVLDPEDFADVEGFERIDRQTDFQRFLAPPPQTPRSGMTGEALFGQVGCNHCHVSSFTSGAAAEAALSNQPLHPYSDFLLHDVGTLGDGIVQGMGTEREIRTAPLWGLSVRAPLALLHDGSASGQGPQGNLLAAIVAHDGEAAASSSAFLALTSPQRDQVLAFLLSLGQLEFDAEHDNDVEVFDWFFIQFNGWFTGPGAGTLPPDHPGAIADADQDGDCDLVDFGLLQRAMTH